GALALASTQAANIPQAATAAGDFTSLLKATETAGLSGYVGGPGPFTMFAPNDAAFAKVPKAKLDMLMQPENSTKLKVTLGNHLVTGLLPMEAIDKGLAQADAVSVMAINNMPLIIKRENGVLTVNGAHVVKPPMKVDNGIVYVIDGVLMPAMPLQPTY
ncbi:MAG: fasciclin domain-containing protein, partial [Sphingomonadaceae bacterium]|nr:fasciclin domain-containing protein [Sphingomonadaceae bacterium]